MNVTSVGEEENGGGTNLSGWAEDAAGLHRDFQFSDFTTAWRFMGLVATAAERSDHHPDWSNSYNRVSITLISHDVGKVTGRDRRLAALIDEIHHTVSVEDR